MPKIVDHEARRQDVAKALWRSVEQHGSAGLSVRKVAAAAGLSVGAMRHYFDGQDDLIRFAVDQLVADVRNRVQERAAALADRKPSVAELCELLEEALPLDARRRAEHAVWLELMAHASSGLSDVASDVHRDLRGLCHDVVGVIAGHAPQEAVDALHAMLDGLAMHLALQPTELSAARARGALLAHLTTLRPEPNKAPDS